MRIVQRLNERFKPRNELLSENIIKHSSQPGGLAPNRYGPESITQAFFANSNILLKQSLQPGGTAPNQSGQ